MSYRKSQVAAAAFLKYNFKKMPVGGGRLRCVFLIGAHINPARQQSLLYSICAPLRGGGGRLSSSHFNFILSARALSSYFSRILTLRYARVVNSNKGFDGCEQERRRTIDGSSRRKYSLRYIKTLALRRKE